MMRKPAFVFHMITVCFLFGCSVTSANTELEKAKTPPRSPASTACTNRIEGDWDYGTAPSACNVTAMFSAEQVRFEYSPVILDEGQIKSGARFKYMSLMYTVVRDLSNYYIRRRNPNVSAAEEQGFLAGVLALVTQESKWTHFRLGSDEILRYMRGDRLHGYGLMQVDDRSFLTKIKEGLGADLVTNMIFGLDLYYSNWVRATKVKCLKSDTNYKDRARAAWSAYNGGESQICRWTKKKGRYASHDRSYLDHFTKRPWSTYVADTGAPSPLDVRCLAEGVRPCAAIKMETPSATAFDLIAVESPQLARISVANHGILNAKIPYRYLKACAAETCDSTSRALRAGERVGVLSEAKDGWLQVQIESDGYVGWIKRAELTEI